MAIAYTGPWITPVFVAQLNLDFAAATVIGNSTALVGPTAPVGAQANQLWWNSTDGQLYIYYYDGTSTQWVPVIIPGAGSLTLTGPLVGTTATFSGAVSGSNGFFTDTVAGGYVLFANNQTNETGFTVPFGVRQGNSGSGTNYTELHVEQNAVNDMAIEVSDQANAKGILRLQPFGGSIIAGAPLTGTTATLNGGGVNGALKVTTNDSIIGGLFAGATKGVRIVPNAAYTAIEGVDNTGVGSYQPLTINGSVVNITAPLTGTSVTFSGTLSASLAQISSATKGIRLLPGTTGSTIMGTDQTGTGSYQPLTIDALTTQFMLSGASKATLDGSGFTLGTPLTGTTATFSGVATAAGFTSSIDTSNYALLLGRYSSGFGRVAINTRGAYGYEFQVNGTNVLDLDATVATFSVPIAGVWRIPTGGENVLAANAANMTVTVPAGAKQFQIDYDIGITGAINDSLQLQCVQSGTPYATADHSNQTVTGSGATASGTFGSGAIAFALNTGLWWQGRITGTLAATTRTTFDAMASQVVLATSTVRTAQSYMLQNGCTRTTVTGFLFKSGSANLLAGSTVRVSVLT